MSNSKKISKANSIRGTINLPGDKSISHRAAMISAMAAGTTRIENFATSADCAATLRCLGELGAAVERDGTTVAIGGVGKNGFRKPEKPLDCGNSGTTMRLLAGILAGQNFAATLVGDASLSRRPMRRIIEPLEKMGARIESADGRAPLKIRGKNPLGAITHNLEVASAQIKSCILLAALNATGKSKILNPESKLRMAPSRNHTELMFEYLGARIKENFIESDIFFVHEISIDGRSKLRARDLQIPADISSASFFLVAASCLAGSEILLENVGLNITRSAIIEVLQGFGADITIRNIREVSNEIFGDLLVRGGEKLDAKVVSNIIEGDQIANLIDEIPVLAVLGTQLAGGLEIRDAEELRVKESDRIAAVCENLRKMNAEVEEFADGLRVARSDLRGAKIDSYGDHRIAMAFAVAGLLAEGETEIGDAGCVSVSFPEFFEVLENVVE
jgi:3-phosphoshikimate 1-carboxyvinyltransferase